ncbi:hypothetical protein [Neptuniibacter sp. QD37_11]|uniref:hypothetical protein n=1 Tax=Neptuniibacter sp. QD37_11 TaxID=3398209 RepID=UPI0039F49EF0
MELFFAQFSYLTKHYHFLIWEYVSKLLGGDQFVLYLGGIGLFLLTIALYVPNLAKKVDEGTAIIFKGITWFSSLIMGGCIIFACYLLYQGNAESWQQLNVHQKNSLSFLFTCNAYFFFSCWMVRLVALKKKRIIGALAVCFGFLMFFFDDGSALDEGLRIQVMGAIFGAVVLLNLLHKLFKWLEPQPPRPSRKLQNIERRRLERLEVLRERQRRLREVHSRHRRRR